MMVQASANGPGAVPDLAVAEALAEPLWVATSWMQAPPWALVALVVLTIALMLLSNRTPSDREPSAS
ncbi:MAG: hypothetical protein H6737_10210 [Alphaproteobacteria bacterium]|nr:hypothetical protein [Alphaproteobacteria bacterium]